MDPTTEHSQPRLIFRALRLWYVRLPLELLLVLLLWSYIIQFRPTSGSSMLPTLKEGGYVFVDKLSYLLREPRRGEVVVIRSNEQPPEFFCKRIVALPGEEFEIRDGQVFINGFPLEESYIIRNNSWNADPMRIRDRHYFVIGDNRGMAMIQHWHGLAAIDNIQGRVIGKTHDYGR